MLPDFEMLLPTTLDDALKSMAAKLAVPVAGGTNVIVDLRNGRHTPDARTK
jgi:CO/xanthine dehydrogenase FAD-binding subunit